MPEDCLRDEVCITETNTECSCTLPPPPPVCPWRTRLSSGEWVKILCGDVADVTSHALPWLSVHNLCKTNASEQDWCNTILIILIDLGRILERPLL